MWFENDYVFWSMTLELKNNRLLIYPVCVCDQMCNKIWNAEFKRDKYFVDEVESQLRENHSEAAKPRISTIQKTKLVTKQ
jgi:hypothetical protein